MTKTWLITGCSTGFGRLLAQAALDRGDQVVATARNPATLSDIAKDFPKTARTIALDVTKAGDAEKAVALAMDAFGRLDVLVNNAGFGFIGAIEEATPDEYRPMFETNIIGLLETTRSVAGATKDGRRRPHRQHVVRRRHQGPARLVTL
jgi:NADP-dependent 3-hydroxy acid dehydrogenase YdfG